MKPPALSFLATLTVEVGEPIEIGATPEGHRRIIPITGGTVEGPELTGVVLPGGADYQLLRSPTVTEMDARYALRTTDGDGISVHNSAIRSGSADDIARLVRGEPVDPARIYFRSSPRLLATGERWAWLNSRILVGVGERTPSQVRLQLWVVE